MNSPLPLVVALFMGVSLAYGQFADLARVTPGRTGAVNALWMENPLSVQFKTAKRVVVAEIEGPAEITMIHFAYPMTGALNRDLVLRVYWDGEATPSVECPLVDFFGSPAGLREVVNTALVNVRRGYNAYFPMPFRKSARVELEYDGPVAAGEELWNIMPCYSYVCYRTLEEVPADMGYFCASWRQEALKMGLRDYVALEATGKGKFVGWNVTIRRPGSPDYPVDGNEKFYIDGEEEASIEFQGLEDSFGFSWGFPSSESIFPLTGYFPFMEGAAAYRFFTQDAIHFEKSLKVAIGFGEHENEFFRKEFSKFGNSLQLSTTVYWYQVGPRAPLPPLPAAADRAPAPQQLFWPESRPVPTAEECHQRGVKLLVWCGHPGNEVIHNDPGYTWAGRVGRPYTEWSGEVSWCLADDKQVELTIDVPKSSKGTLRLYLIDPDDFQGGRKESITVTGQSTSGQGAEGQNAEGQNASTQNAGAQTVGVQTVGVQTVGVQTVGTFDNFQSGKWVEIPVTPEQTASGRLQIHLQNENPASNAVVSKLEWVEKL